MTKYEFPATPMFGDETNTWIPRGSGSDRDFLSYKTLTIHEAASLYYGIHPGRLNEILWENGTMWHSLFYNTVNQLCRAVMSGEIRTPDKNIQTLGDVSEHTSMLTDSVLSYFAKERINGEGKPSEKTFLNDIYISDTERQTMLKIIIGMAIDAYGYDPNATRNAATGDKNGISAKLATHGITLSDDTIRKYLNEAKNLL